MSGWAYRIYVDSTGNLAEAELEHAYIEIISREGDSAVVGSSAPCVG